MSHESYRVMQHYLSANEKEPTVILPHDEGSSKHVSANYFNKSFASVARSMSTRSGTGLHDTSYHLNQHQPAYAPPVILPPQPYLSPPNTSPKSSRGTKIESILNIYIL
jgi:hypothetical protein